MKEKNVQISEQTFLDLYLLCDGLNRRNEIDQERLSRVTLALENKLEAMAKRSLFTQYKTSPQGSKEREELRGQYLEQVGVHKDWQTPTETTSL